MARRGHCRGAPPGGEVGLDRLQQAPAESVLARVYREEAGRLTGSLVRVLGDFDLAEEVVQDAIVTALERWPRDAIPATPGASLFTVARRRAIDRIRRDHAYHERLASLATPTEATYRDEPDDRLRLIFTCCHPALSREAQVALTLRTICGLTTAEIARAFLISESTVAQRIVRAKRKIVEAGIPYRIPEGDEMSARLAEVLAVLYLMFNEGYLASSGGEPQRRELTEDAAWLAGLMVRLMPEEPECWGLLALMRLHLARAAARFDADARLVRLQEQDRSRWDRRMIAEAVGMLERAATLARPGPYQLQAAIAACHAEAASFDATDWKQIVSLYDSLVELGDSPVIRLNRAVALSHVRGAELALDELGRLGTQLDTYHLYHATRAELLDQVGRGGEGDGERRRALELTENTAERRLLEDAMAGNGVSRTGLRS